MRVLKLTNINRIETRRLEKERRNESIGKHTFSRALEFSKKNREYIHVSYMREISSSQLEFKFSDEV